MLPTYLIGDSNPSRPPIRPTDRDAKDERCSMARDGAFPGLVNDEPQLEPHVEPKNATQQNLVNYLWRQYFTVLITTSASCRTPAYDRHDLTTILDRNPQAFLDTNHICTKLGDESIQHNKRHDNPFACLLHTISHSQRHIHECFIIPLSS